MDIENTLDDYKGILSYVNLNNDNKTFNLIKTEINEVIANKANYIYKKENAKLLVPTLIEKKKKLLNYLINYSHLIIKIKLLPNIKKLIYLILIFLLLIRIN